jgi:hypothetical protein
MHDVDTPATIPSPRLPGAPEAPLVAVEVAIGAPAPVVTSSRAELLEHLGAGLRLAVAVGDLEAARVAHEAIGRLLGAPPSSASSGVVRVTRGRRKRGPR